jgi:trigger factor
MKVELTDISECKKSLDFEVPQDVVDHEIGHIAQEFARKAKVPGFRPGKAPVAVIKTRYKEEIVSEVMQHILPKSFSEAVKDKKLDLVADPAQPEALEHLAMPLLGADAALHLGDLDRLAFVRHCSDSS